MKVTQSPVKLIAPPPTGDGRTYRYGNGFPFQAGPNTAGVFLNLRFEGFPAGDFEAGMDVVLFDDLEERIVEERLLEIFPDVFPVPLFDQTPRHSPPSKAWHIETADEVAVILVEELPDFLGGDLSLDLQLAGSQRLNFCLRSEAFSFSGLIGGEVLSFCIRCGSHDALESFRDLVFCSSADQV